MKFYVYALCYPNGDFFYIGKGQGKRIDDHENDAKRGVDNKKCDVIRDIWISGDEVLKKKLFETDDETEALEEEKRQISSYGKNNLVNILDGGGVPRSCESHKQMVTITIPQRDYLREVAKRLGVSLSEVIRQAIDKMKKDK